MNQIDANPDYKELYKIVASKFKKTNLFSHGPLDEVFFTMRVYETSKDLISKTEEPVNTSLILVSAILHDIGKIKLDEKILNLKFKDPEKVMVEWNRHPELSIPLAKEILEKLEYSKEFIEEVCFLVGNHHPSNYAESIELKILQDADQLADYGYTDIIRSFSHSGMYNHGGTIGAIKWLKSHPIERRQDRLNLEMSKEIGKEKLKIHNNILKELSKRIQSDLLD